jgi:hypothetical protein
MIEISGSFLSLLILKIMETLTITSNQTVAIAGQTISREHADYLINGFKENFPNEKPTVFISKETLLKAASQIDNISGIRFMYGFEAVNNGEARVLSRMLVLKPCVNIAGEAVPAAIALPEYITDNGTIIDAEKSRRVLHNQTARFSRYFPNLGFDKIMRGVFISANSLFALVELHGCVGINFHFGYDEAISNAPERNKPVMEAINSQGECINFSLLSPPCPPMCGFGDIFNL